MLPHATFRAALLSIVGIGLWGCDSGASSDGSGGGGGGATVPVGAKPEQGPPAFVVGSFSVELPAITLAPGEEAFPCFIAPLVIDGPSRVVGGGSVTVGKGMHHGNITSRPKTGEGFRECPKEGSLLDGEAGDILAGGSVLFGSTTQVEGTEWRRFPDGMGFPVGEGSEVVLRMHYLNPTAESLTVQPKYEWLTIDETKVTELLGPLVWRYAAFEIPPHGELTVTADCLLPTDAAPMHIVDMMPHMHKLGTNFTASYAGGSLDGKPFLESTGYNPDGLIRTFQPSVDIAPGEGFHFSCTWENTFDKPIVEGVGDDEMCMMFGYAYPYESAFTAMDSPNGACVLVSPPRPAGF
jgi:hypothetical protein